MELTIADSVATNPAAADIAAALGVPSFPEGWCITLDDGDDVMIDAEYDPVGAFRVSVWEHNARRHAVKDLDAGTLSAMLQMFLAHDPSWRDLSAWESAEEQKLRTRAEAAARKQELAVLAAARPTPPGSPMASIASLVILAFAGFCAFKLATQGLAFITDMFPKAQAQLAVLTGAMGLAALLLAIGGLRRFQQARGWPTAAGRVIVSKVQAYRDSDADARGKRLRAPLIEFAYRVDGRDYRSSQRQLGTTTGGSEGWASGITARYPVGAAVEVRYNPADPADATLENPIGIVGLVLAASLLCLAVSVHALHPFG